ncbi:MAG TPA: ABC transporter permease [bacterium]|nr:MAG: binding-protein-dependent transport system inner membrane protein [Armatimonadetes bacterium CSP1-3]HLE77661.1 ABC transporter permease [bacterium]
MSRNLSEGLTLAAATGPSWRTRLGILRRILFRDLSTAVGITVIVLFVLVALLAPVLMTDDPWAINRRPNGTIARLDPPSRAHWLGTTDLGRDIYSQVVVGSRAALLVGFLAALMTTVVGTSVAVIAGYFGGWVDDLLMRVVDFAYAVPFVPFVIILVSLLKPSLANVIIAIALLYWRSSARVIRAQVLSLRERPYIKAARVAGAGPWRIIYHHITPNILPLAMLYMAIGVGWAIITESSVSFLGLGDPLVISWGSMLNLAFTTGAMQRAWWWVLPPGFSIILLVVATFLVGRSVEEYANPRLRGEV